MPESASVVEISFMNFFLSNPIMVPCNRAKKVVNSHFNRRVINELNQILKVTISQILSVRFCYVKLTKPNYSTYYF